MLNLNKCTKRTFQYKGENLVIEVGQYAHNSNTSLELVDPKTGEYWITASVGIISPLPPLLVAIKNYSENKGILDWLVENHLVRDTGKEVFLSQFVNANVVEVVDSELRDLIMFQS